jgi:hypothetical protein
VVVIALDSQSAEYRLAPGQCVGVYVPNRCEEVHCVISRLGDRKGGWDGDAERKMRWEVQGASSEVGQADFGRNSNASGG